MILILFRILLTILIYLDEKRIMLHDTAEFVSQQTQYESIRKFFAHIMMVSIRSFIMNENSIKNLIAGLFVILWYF